MIIKKDRSSTQDGMFLTRPDSIVFYKGLLVTLAVSFLLLLFSTLLFYYLPLPEILAPYFIFTLTLASILLGSFYLGKRVEKRGLLKGGLLGLVYVLILLLLSSYMSPEFGVMGQNILTKFLFGFLAGGFGGIIGIKMGRANRKTGIVS